MKYSYEFKLRCVEMYRNGEWMETPKGIKEHNFRRNVEVWSRLVEEHGPEILKHNGRNKIWTPEEKLELISQVKLGKSISSVAIKAGINNGLLYAWVKKYQELGYNGLVESKKGKPSKNPNMKKNTNPKPLTESEREELIRLRAENEYMKAEIAARKKEQALRYKRWDEQLKAKKQRLSKNSEKKDTH